MKCTNCGTELTEGAAFCPECGSPVNNRQQEPEATAETKQETVANEPAEAVTEKLNRHRQKTRRRKQRPTRKRNPTQEKKFP